MDERRVGADIKGAAGAALVLIALAALIDNGIVGWGFGLSAFALLLYAVNKAPLRVSFMTLAFFVVVLENPADMFGAGKWQSPFYLVGALMLTHMKNVTGVSFMFLSGTDVMLICLIVVALRRGSKKGSIDRLGHVPVPRPLVRLAGVSIAGTVYVWASGLLRGGDFSTSLWQIDKVVYMPVVFLVAQAALRGPKDYLALARVLLVAAGIRAALAVYIVNTVVMAPDVWGNPQVLPWATTHHDSMLFADAVVLIISLFVHRVPRSKMLVVALLPILFWGMMANNRRMVWVQILLVFTTLYFVMPTNPIKRKLQRTLKIVGPILIVYVAVGWNTKAAPFAPVQTIRGMVDSQDSSSITRDIENYDLVYTIKQFHIWGTGYGNGYWEMISLPPMGYDLERFCPHNSLLGLWVYSGYFGFVAMTLLWNAGVFFGVLAYRSAKRGTDRAAALTSFGAVLVYIIQCYGDVGLGAWTGVFTVAPAIAMAGKIAVSIGAWPLSAQATSSKKTEHRQETAQPGNGISIGESRAGDAS